MNRSARRKLERQIQLIMKNAGDNCSLCGKPFPHNSRTFGGRSDDQKAALVGECCAYRITEIVLSGVFVSRNYDTALNSSGSSQKSALSAEQLSEAVGQLQDRIAKIDKLGSDILKRAGVQPKNVEVDFSANSWKSDDASWFKKNPSRSHRLRALFPGEAATLPADALRKPAPPGHEFQILVRQVEVGRRIRTQFCRNLATPIPDLEEVVHAIFDLVTGRGREGVISVQEVVDLTRKYASGSEGGTEAN